MATISDVYRSIEARINKRMQEFMLGSWLDMEKSPEWHGLFAAREQAQIEGLREALTLIDELQRDN